MKNLFEIDSSEIKRILNLHEERTKTQYLDVVSEQTTDTSYKTPSYTTSTQLMFSSNYDIPYTLPKDVSAKFMATNDSNIVTAKNVKLTQNKNGTNVYETKNISFYCNQGKFYFSGNKNPYYQEMLSPSLIKNVCGRLNTKSTRAKSGAVYNQGSDVSFIGENGLEVFTIGKGTQWKWDGTYGKISGGAGVIKSNNINKNFTNVMFSCTPKGEFYFALGSDRFKDKDYGLTKALKNSFCQVVAKQTQQGTPTQTTTPTNIPEGAYSIKNSYTLGNGAIKIGKGDVVSKYGNNAIIKRGNTIVTSFDCTTGKFNTRAGQVGVDGGKTILTDTIKSKFCTTPTPTNTTTTTTSQAAGGAGTQRRRVDIAPSIRNVQKSVGVAQTGSFDTETLNKIIQQL